jgi:hypothetical protein
LDFLTIEEDRTHTLSPSVGEEHSTLRNTPEERSCHQHRGGTTKMFFVFYKASRLHGASPVGSGGLFYHGYKHPGHEAHLVPRDGVELFLQFLILSNRTNFGFFNLLPKFQRKRSLMLLPAWLQERTLHFLRVNSSLRTKREKLRDRIAVSSS